MSKDRLNKSKMLFIDLEEKYKSLKNLRKYSSKSYIDTCEKYLQSIYIQNFTKRR